jgi:3-oxoacyl-[acyl-carrier-protein] synthase III
MFIRDISHTLDQASFPSLDTLRASYKWSAHTHRVFERLFGLQSTSLHPALSLGDGLRLSAERLAARNPDLLGRVDAIIYAHALNVTLPFASNLLEQIAIQVFASRAEVMSISHGSCASAILALHMLRRGRPDLRNIVVLTGEKCFFELLDYADNNGLFGETTSATWVTTTEGPALARIDGTSAGAFSGVFEPLARADKDTAARYNREFLPTLERAVGTALADAELATQRIGAILPTHLSPFTFNRIAHLMGLPEGLVFKANLPRIGHCFCGDLFINLETWARQDHGPAAVTLMSFAAGMTGAYAAIVLTHKPHGAFPT